MKRILFPFDTAEESTNDTRGASWVGLDPLEMATKLAALVEGKTTTPSTPTLIERRSLPPLQIDTAFLSTENPNLPEVPNGIRNVDIEEYDSTERSYLQSPEHRKAMSSLQGKRGRAEPYTYRDEESESKLCVWDPSFLLKYNPDHFTSRYAVQQLSALSKELAITEGCDGCNSSYQRIKDRLLEESRFINSSSKSQNEKVQCFSQLYSSAIQQMQALIEMASKKNNESDVVPRNFHDSGDEETQSEDNSSVVGISRGEYSKRDFTDYMNNWLKENWTNPYPDDEGLATIAAINGTSPTTVSNWLINARTRKWRPAIVKAYESGAQADNLREDSMKSFDDNNIGKVNIVQP